MHVYEFVEPERPYTYIYQGESETLDHILITPVALRAPGGGWKLFTSMPTIRCPRPMTLHLCMSRTTIR